MNLKCLLFSFKGRINRQPYWLFSLCAFALWFTLSLLLGIDILHRGRSAKSLIPTIILIWPSLAVQVKRWHDRDKSGWWLLINLIPIVGPLWAFIENGFLSGTPGENRYGDDPLGRASDSTPAAQKTPATEAVPQIEWSPGKYYLSAFMKSAMIFGLVMLIFSSVIVLSMSRFFAADMPGLFFFVPLNVAFAAVLIWRIRVPLIELSEEGLKVNVPFLFKSNSARWEEIDGMVIEDASTFGYKESKLKFLLKASDRAATKEIFISLKAVEKPDEVVTKLKAKIPEKGYEDIKQSAVLLQKPVTQAEMKYRGWILNEKEVRKGKETIPWEKVKEIKYAGLVIAGYGATTISYSGGGGRLRSITAKPSATGQYQDFIRYLIQHSVKASIDPGLLKALEYAPKDARADMISLLFVATGLFFFFVAASFLNYYSPTVATGNVYPFLIIPFGLLPMAMAIKLMVGRFRGKIETASRKTLWSSFACFGPVASLLVFFALSPFSFYWFVGDIFNKTGNPEQAESSYRRALERFPDSLDIPYELGKLYREKKDYENASRYLQQAYTKDPSYWGPAAILLIPDTLLKMGKHEEALKWCEQILQNHPNKVDIRNAISKKQREIIWEMDFYKQGTKKDKAQEL